MKKYITGIALIMSLCIFTGCGAQAPAAGRNDAEMTQVSESERGNMEEMTQMSEIEVTDDGKMTQMSQAQNGTSIKETEDSVYFFGKTCIYIVDKASDRAEVLWKNDNYEPRYDVFDGCGVILGKRLYFIESVDRIRSTAIVLSAINTDGSGYEQAISGLDAADYFNSIYYSDNILYVYNNKFVVQCYQVLEDGSLGGQIPQEETAFRYTQDLGENYRLLNNGAECGNFLSPVESIEKYGSLILKKKSSYVKIDVESGSEEWINFGSPEYMEGNKVFYIEMQSDIWKLQSFDLNTKEITTICDIKGTGLLRTAYANGILYYMASDDNNNKTVNCISVADQTGSVLLELNDTSGYVDGFSPANFGLRVSGNALYYMDMRDYDTYLIRVDLDNMEQTLLQAPVYCTNINKVGKLAQEHHDIYKENDPEALLGTADFNWIVVDDSFAGAETINTSLYESEIAGKWTMFEDDVRMDEEFIDEYNLVYQQNPDTMYGMETIDEYRFCYRYDSDIPRICYFDGTYVSFIQECDEYRGGAHGMLTCEGYVFNLETGERLLLMDILSDTEEELKNIVTKYFGEKIDESPEDFWADAKETVHDTISLETTDFVLTNDGICFYMNPYSIAAFVFGFPDVTVPYSEFQMKILD